MNKNLKVDYKKSTGILRGILNIVDPEGLEPGQEGGSPIDEYDDEVAKIYSFVIHNLEDVKLNKNLLADEINRIWMESFGNTCQGVDEIVDRIIKELF